MGKCWLAEFISQILLWGFGRRLLAAAGGAFLMSWLAILKTAGIYCWLQQFAVLSGHPGLSTCWATQLSVALTTQVWCADVAAPDIRHPPGAA